VEPVRGGMELAALVAGADSVAPRAAKACKQESGDVDRGGIGGAQTAVAAICKARVHRARFAAAGRSAGEAAGSTKLCWATVFVAPTAIERWKLLPGSFSIGAGRRG